MNFGKTFAWFQWALTQVADYVIKLDTDVSANWHLLLSWTRTMRPPAYFGMILTNSGCGSQSFCPPVGCTNFNSSCWIYMSGGMYGISKDVVDSISRCAYARRHKIQHEDMQLGLCVKHCAHDVHLYNMRNCLMWCHSKTDIDIHYIARGRVPAGCHKLIFGH
jgi:Galactosyltransferase